MVLNDNGADPEMIRKWPSTDVQSDRISDTYSSVKNPPGDYRRFNPPAIAIKRKRKGKVARHFNQPKNDTKTVVEGGKNFDVFTNEESQTSVT